MVFALIGRRFVEKQHGINACVVQADAPVQMWTGNATGFSYCADYLADDNLLARFNINSGHVAIHGDQSLTMIDKNRIAIKKVIAGVADVPTGGGPDGGAFRRCQIKATVGFARLLVEIPP